jgi:hypothetical protein
MALLAYPTSTQAAASPIGSGGLSADQLRAQTLALYLTSRPNDSAFQQAVRDVVSSLYLNDVPACGPGRCCESCGQSVGRSGVQTGVSFAGAAAAPFTFGLSTVFSTLFGGFLGFHSQHLAQDRSVFCPILQQTNDALQQLDAAVASGKISYADAVAYLDQTLSKLKNSLSGLHSQCTANMLVELASYCFGIRKVVEYKPGGRFAPPVSISGLLETGKGKAIAFGLLGAAALALK